LGPGAMFAYAPTTRCEIRVDPRDPMVKYFLDFAGADVGRRLRAAGVPLGGMRLLAAHAEILSVLEDLLHEGHRPGKLGRRICGLMFELLLLKIKGASAVAPRVSEPAREAFLRCKALIDAQAERHVTLKQIAGAVGVEPTTVCRWFHRYQGSSPYQYLLRRKMKLAAELLVENGGFVKETAARVGFSDPYHFSRCFKSVHGVAPRNLLRYHQRKRG